jgi:hypothetical protein
MTSNPGPDIRDSGLLGPCLTRVGEVHLRSALRQRLFPRALAAVFPIAVAGCPADGAYHNAARDVRSPTAILVAAISG